MSKQKIKKVKKNPNRRPATIADVNRAKKEALRQTWTIFFSVLKDKEGYGKKRLQRIWDEVDYLSDSISQGRVSIKDLETALEEESGIVLIFGKEKDNDRRKEE